MAFPVSVVSIGSISPLGCSPHDTWKSYLSSGTCIKTVLSGESYVPVAQIPEKIKAIVDNLRKAEPKYYNLDDSVLYAILASRMAIQGSGWSKNDIFGINIGSSRGATHLFEKHHSEFLLNGKTSTQASPSTTLGNISSWVAHDLKCAGPEISHSITCSTSLHAVLNGIAWLRSGMASKFLAGGTEAALTPFTIAQMKGMKIYSSLDSEYPSRALDTDKTSNTMVLGEGAASACLEAGYKPDALAIIEGLGYATEILEHSASLSADALCLQKSMEMALANTNKNDVDAIVMHAPGTIKGDRSEYIAIQKVFGEKVPSLTTNKWKIGHTFGASGMLSLEMAIQMLQHNTFIPVPYLNDYEPISSIKKILVNAVGFGGNAVSILIARP